ncbi:phage portal protein [Paenibacillus lentus]|uniref:Phage portal protein n=2 Tax=Paenibacillus lentus TaxID=1338368 RepID=A0A3S8S148_9BACL|nr:phage portal protein [Paenibacillus lentus]
MSHKKFLEREIIKFKKSKKRKDMLEGERYYRGDHDILNRRRTVIGENGLLQEVENLPNNKIIDNQYAKLVDQKVNYLLAKPLTFETENDEYAELLQGIFNNRFLRTFKNLGEDSLNHGIAWLLPYYNELGEFCFKKLPPYEVLPFWKDAEHTILDCAVRIYQVEAYEGEKEVTIEKVELYDANGIHRFIWKNNSLVDDVENPFTNYLIAEDEEGNQSNWNWAKVPLIPFKYNNKEIPLITRVKSLQDGINTILSDFQNNMQEDARNTILVLQNYDGTNLGEFRRNLAQYGAVKVKTVDGAAGDLKTLEIHVNAENYKVILELFKKALIENGRGFDAKDDRMSGTPNQMNIQSMYSDIDLDANGMETEYQASFEELLWFVNVHLSNTGNGDFEKEKVKVIFNRDILINESESIENCVKSVGILSDETIVTQHPWTSNTKLELQRKLEEAKSAMDDYKNAFPLSGGEKDDQT